MTLIGIEKMIELKSHSFSRYDRRDAADRSKQDNLSNRTNERTKGKKEKASKRFHWFDQRPIELIFQNFDKKNQFILIEKEEKRFVSIREKLSFLDKFYFTMRFGRHDDTQAKCRFVLLHLREFVCSFDRFSDGTSS